MKSFLHQVLRLVRRPLDSWASPPWPQNEQDAAATSAKLSSTASAAAAAAAAAAHPSGLHGEALTLALQINGKNFHLPDLRKVFAEWPMAYNPRQKEIETLVNELLERIISHPKKLKALKQADFAQLIALWYPHADWAELVAATTYSVWIFVWDDEVDVGDTEISNDKELARAYYKSSLDYIRQNLGLVDGPMAANNKAPHPTMALFADVGRDIRPATDAIQRQRFYRELEGFMLQVGVEHTYRMSGGIPSIDKYMEIRTGSVGCAPQIAITDFMLRVRLPESIMESEAMRSLWHETVVICLILNDIYSVKKEIDQGSLLNIVPVLFKHFGPEAKNLDRVTEELERMLQESMSKFEQAAKSLDDMTAGQEQENKDVRSFVEWSRYFITGVLYWSLDSRRYGMAKCGREDGSLDIILKANV